MTVSELRRLADQATPAPWASLDGWEPTHRVRSEDLALIVAMRNSLPALLACAEAAQGLTTELAAKSDSEVTASLAALDAALAALDGETA